MLKTPVNPTERFYIRLCAWFGGGALVLVLITWGGLSAFHQWQEGHLVRKAAAILSGGDFKSASLAARRAYQLNPNSADAARVLAQAAQRAGDRAEIDWRRKVVELLPQSTEDALALVRAAMRANDLATVEKTLQSIGESGRQSASYHAARGRFAEMRANLAEAEQHWVKAAELAPDDAAYQTQLAVVQLGSGDPAKREGALRALEGLRTNPQQRAAATRALLVDGASRATDAQRLRTLAAELQSYPEAVFADRILYLEILRQLRDPGYVDYLAEMQRRAAATAADLAALLSWMSNNGGAQEAIAFASGLPADRLSEWPVPLAHADAYAKAQDWQGLRRHAGTSNWQGFEFMRHAYLARAHRAVDDHLVAEQEWVQAQKAASTHPQSILVLAQTVATWDWQAERLDLLWAAAKKRESRLSALQLLYQHYAQHGDTAGLYRVLLRSTEAAPDDTLVQNNFAQVSLLLNADADRARRLAADLVRMEPTNGAYVSTHAFGLYTGGDVEGALRAFEALKPEQLEVPSVAAYYGIVLAAAGQKEKAREYLQRGTKAFLLPEEKALLAKAEASAN